MPDLSFSVEGAEPVAYAACPMLAIKLKIRNSNSDEQIHSVMLQAQVRIEAARRHYEPNEQARLRDLFGEPERWNQTLRTMLWTHANLNVRPFRGETIADLPIPCSFDFNVAATKYFDGLSQGEIPLCFLFSGTVFYAQGESGLRISQIPWEKEAHFQLPLATWKRVIDQYYPNTAWLTLRRDVFDRLHEFKRRRGIATWEQAVEQLLS
ncbi:MAG TPA: DUF6084 family protein [Bryobacteraceae bacterium]|nr:DUF6084 family protein [Bryobacteraceae bacterium]